MSSKNKKSAEAASGKKGTKASKNAFGHPVRNLILTALVSILLGVAFLVRPSDIYSSAQLLIGGLVALVGVVYILIYFIRKPVSGEYRSEFAIGLVLLLLGAYVAVGDKIALLGGGVGLRQISVAIGLFIIADGLLKLQYSIDLARMKYSKWWIMLILAILGIGIGVVSAIDFTARSATASVNNALPDSFLYGMGGQMGLIRDKGDYNAFFSGMMVMGIAYCVNGLFDLVSMLLVILRNRQAARDEAIAEAAQKLVEAQKENDPALFTVGNASAPVSAAPSEEVVFQVPPAPVSSAPQPTPEPVAAEPPKTPEPTSVPPEPSIPIPTPAEPAEDA